MKKVLMFSILMVSFGIALGQTKVHKLPYVYENEAVNAYVVLSNQEPKELKSDLEKFLSGYGKLNSSNKNVFRLEKIKLNKISDQIENIEVQYEADKSFNRLVFLFLDGDNKPLVDMEYSEKESIKWIEEFEKYTLNNLEIRLSEKNVAFLDDQYRDAEKSIKKIEKNIENNLKDQEKLGKKLDQSPELMAKALSEKENLVEKLYSSDSTQIDNKSRGEISKASEKKEKEISKIKKESEKASSKLEKKEAEFIQLKDELFMAKKLLSSREKALDGAKVLLARLKK